jgi:Spy/CpxP family protein refolding chaperone
MKSVWTIALAMTVGVATVALPTGRVLAAGARGPRAAMARGTQPTTAERPGLERLRKALDKLSLSADQTQQINKILAEAQTRIDALRNQFKADKTPVAQRRTAVRQVIEQTRQAVASVLTAEQKEALRKELGDGPQRVKELREHLAQLGLTDQQKAQIKAIFEDVRPKLQALRQELAKAAPADRPALSEKLRAMVQETRQRVAAVLTPAQREKLRSLGGEMAPVTQP